ncbi:MAG: hypothetical protein GVY26_20105, partial [Bacteroidetes bacterium]|nr:hypothetical protein [Bacteroidota bacterium]
MNTTTTINLTATDVKQAISEFVSRRHEEFAPSEDEISFITSPNRVLAKVTITEDEDDEASEDTTGFQGYDPHPDYLSPSFSADLRDDPDGFWTVV